MNATCPETPKLADIPLWRLLVMLDDIERTVGASSESAQLFTREIQRRLRGTPPTEKKAVTNAAR